jgi:hypothetical protein
VVASKVRFYCLHHRFDAVVRFTQPHVNVARSSVDIRHHLDLMIAFLDNRLINTYLIYPHPLDFVFVVTTISKPVQACPECLEEIEEILSYENDRLFKTIF